MAEGGRYERSASGMVGAMVVLLLLIGGFVVLRELNRTTPEATVPTVDWARVADSARSESGFDVLAPPSLPAGWRATSATYTPPPEDAWHLGLLTDGGRYVGLEQSEGTPVSMVRTYVDAEATRAGSVNIRGQRWSVWTDAKGDTALVRDSGEVTTLVVGTVDRDVLVEYVESLR